MSPPASTDVPPSPATPSPPLPGITDAGRPMGWEFKTFFILLALGVAYFSTYAGLSALGKYSEQLYSSGLEATAGATQGTPDVTIWQPKSIVCDPRGQNPFDRNLAGYIYYPLVFIDRLIWHESKYTNAPDADADAPYPVVTPPDALFYSAVGLALFGAFLFLAIRCFWKLRAAGVSRVPHLPYFILFAIPGGWSLLFSLVYYLPQIRTKELLLCLVAAAPGATTLASINLAELPERTVYHRCALWLGFAYPALVVLLVVAATITEHW